jgi:hypothetical protein
VRAREVPYVVRELSELKKIPWLARVRLRRIRRERRTGLLLHGIINTSSRSMSHYAPVISVREGRERLGWCAPAAKLPKWAARAPGVHELKFYASTDRTHSSFKRSFDLRDGDVLVAICRPIQDKWWFQERQPADIWYLGILSPTPDECS